MKSLPAPLAITLWSIVIFSALASAADPTVTNVRAAQKTGTKQVEIYYDISGSTSPVFVTLQVSSNGGTNFAVPATALSGDVGAGVSLWAKQEDHLERRGGLEQPALQHGEIPRDGQRCAARGQDGSR